MDTNDLGKPHWLDLTVPNAEQVRDFYSAVCGWGTVPHPMGDYTDYSMTAADGQTVAGVCHARGDNAGYPAMWLPYVNVPSLAEALTAAEDKGGKVVVPMRDLGSGFTAVIQDPAGACMALWEAKEPPSDR
ncbi:MAG: VOC family protein [Pseudomonadota bacterium]